MQIEKKEIKKNSKYFFSTYISAIFARVPVLPLERLVILQQTNRINKYKNKKGRTSNLSFLNNIRKKDGIKGIFKGNLTFLCKIIPHTALEFSFFEIIKKKIITKQKDLKNENLIKNTIEIKKNIFLNNQTNSDKKKELINSSKRTKNIFFEKSEEKFFGINLTIEKVNFISGCLAGLISTYIMYPMDFCRIMVSLNKTPKNFYPLKNLLYLYNKFGFFNLYKGSFITALSYFPYCGFRFCFFEYNKKVLKKLKNGIFKKNTEKGNDKNFNTTIKNGNFAGNQNLIKLSIFEKVLAGGLAGILAQTLVYPLEILGKRRLTQILEDKTKNFQYKDLFFFMIKKNGFREFKYGLMTNYQKVAIINSVGFVMNDLFKENLDLK